LTTRSSSASSTRGCATLLLLQGNPGRDHRPVTGATVDLDVAAEQERTLSHAGEAETRPVAMPGRVETDAIVPDDHFQSAAHAVQPDLRAGSLRVTPDIAQAFLGDAKQAQCHVLRQSLGDILRARIEPRRTGA